MKWLLRSIVAIGLSLSPWAQSFDARQLSEPVSIGGTAISYPEFALFRLPGTRMSVRAASPINLVGKQAVPAAAKVTELVVPQTPGWYQYQLLNTTTGEPLLLHVYSLIPANRVTAKGYLDAFRIGHYPAKRLRKLAIYDPPPGFIRVDLADKDIRVSPNFTVGQFLSKQAGDYPKYLVLRSALLIKLERILRALNEAGHDVSTFHVMSGYRTPFYNRAIGNVVYSRHKWGGAADIFIDVNPKDGKMDDLNGDGKNDKQDAIWLAGFIDAMARKGQFSKLGGVGTYGSNAAHGPFVHVDVRGYRARW